MERKICSKCGIEKLVSDFNTRKDSKDGYRNECKQCLKLSKHLNYKSLEEDINKNLNEILCDDKSIENPDLTSDQIASKEIARQLAVMQRKKARSERAREKRDNLLKAHPKIRWVEYTMGHHNLTGDVLKEQILELAEKTIDCPICHCKMKYYGGGQAVWISASLDRRNNDDGKTIENFWIICRLCNSTKINRSMEDMDDWCLKWQNARGLSY